MLWESCNNLRGGMDPSQYKDYVLMMLFLKYLSDKDRAGADLLIDIPDGCHFEDIIALKDKPNIGEGINIILSTLAKANPDYATLFAHTVDFSDEEKLGRGKDLVKTVSGLVSCFQRDELNLGSNGAADDDLIGDAYEFLMKKFASQSGKAKGQFYTPAEVSILLAILIGINKDQRAAVDAYDPTCGSCSLVLRARATARTGMNVSINGQEMDVSTIRMAMMNMIIHGVETADLRQGDTLNNPRFIMDNHLMRFDYVVANPPFSQKNWLKSAQRNDVYGRWSEEIGVPPAKCGDYAFLLHVISSMNDTGKGAIILPHGVLFRGGSEAQLRRYIVDKLRCVKGIVGLPPNLFYGTGIPACVIVLDKEGAAQRKGIFFIDAKEGFRKDGDMNRLRAEDIKRIADTWQRGVNDSDFDEPHFAHFARYAEIEANDYNLNIPRYVAPRDTEVRQDIYAHLHGGLPEADINDMAAVWRVCPTLKDTLFAPRQDGYYELRPEEDGIEDAVRSDKSLQDEQTAFHRMIEQWRGMEPELRAIDSKSNPKDLVERWGQWTLDAFRDKPILADAYNLYERFRNYWDETMQDDCYLIVHGGWLLDVRKPKKGKVSYENLECDLLPVSVVLRAFFDKEKSEVDETREAVDSKAAEIQQLRDDNADAFTDDDNKKLTDAAIKKLCKATTPDENTEVYRQYVRLTEEKQKLSRQLSKLTDGLTARVLAQFEALNADEEALKDAVVREKWLYALQTAFNEEHDNAVLAIINDVKALNDRYADTLPDIEQREQRLEQEVNDCLKEMGYGMLSRAVTPGLSQHSTLNKQNNSND